MKKQAKATSENNTAKIACDVGTAEIELVAKASKSFDIADLATDRFMKNIAFLEGENKFLLATKDSKIGWIASPDYLFESLEKAEEYVSKTKFQKEEEQIGIVEIKNVERARKKRAWFDIVNLITLYLGGF